MLYFVHKEKKMQILLLEYDYIDQQLELNRLLFAHLSNFRFMHIISLKTVHFNFTVNYLLQIGSH